MDYKRYINQEMSRDPGICILTYPYSFAWEKTGEFEVRNAWKKYATDSDVFAYVHVPFCAQECHFCGFHKFIGRPYTVIREYLGRSYQEMEIASSLLQNRRPLAVTIGGGTPSMLRASDLARLVRSIRETLNVAETCELTMEVYPDKTASSERLAALKDAGCNRISLGFQSLSDQTKRACNRHDTVEQNLAAYQSAREVGFADITGDLLCGLPHQTTDMWQDSVRWLIDLGLDQICIYPLSIRHPGIPFYEKIREALPGFETLKKMYFWAREELISAGYQQATRHNFKKEHHKGLYEYHQSLGTPCLGIGTNSVSYLPGYTYKNVEGLEEYGSAVRKGRLPVDAGYDLMKNNEDANAFVIKRLTFLSVDKTEFKNRFGRAFDTAYHEQIEALTHSGLAKNGSTHFTLTVEGTYYTALVKRCFFGEKLHRLQTERLGRLKPPIRNEKLEPVAALRKNWNEGKSV
ncbi:MAG: coproporphyrinogen III oxidase family protein [Planctomycetes bacterium]|nr:coproporphyrinogen III oxidase family protein [Planctomycetota bacterium]